MKKVSCPSCGAPYNGRRCRSCNYQHFSEEIAHGNHSHKGEPLVIDSPVRKPIPKKDPFGCGRKTRKKHPLLRFLILLVLINSLMPLVRNWGLKLEAIEESRSAAVPEPAVAQEDILTLCLEDGIHIFTAKQDTRDLSDGLTLYVRNDSKKDVTVHASTLLANNFVIQYGSLYCEADAGTIGKTLLYLDQEELDHAKIQDIRSIAFRLDVCDEGYDLLFSTDLITLGDVPETYPEFEGRLLYAQEGLTVRYLGYACSQYRPEQFGEGSLLFYLENTTEDTLLISGRDTAINGETAEFYLWSELPPGTRTILQSSLYNIAAADIHSPEDALVEFTFDICRNGDFASMLQAGPFRFPAAG